VKILHDAFLQHISYKARQAQLWLQQRQKCIFQREHGRQHEVK
jgi:hypothetical protein